MSDMRKLLESISNFSFADPKSPAVPKTNKHEKDKDDEEDLALPIWAGLLPIETKLGAPITAANASGIPVPSHIAN